MMDQSRPRRLCIAIRRIEMLWILMFVMGPYRHDCVEEEGQWQHSACTEWRINRWSLCYPSVMLPAVVFGGQVRSKVILIYRRQKNSLDLFPSIMVRTIHYQKNSFGFVPLSFVIFLFFCVRHPDAGHNVYGYLPWYGYLPPMYEATIQYHTLATNYYHLFMITSWCGQLQ